MDEILKDHIHQWRYCRDKKNNKVKNCMICNMNEPIFTMHNIKINEIPNNIKYLSGSGLVFKDSEMGVILDFETPQEQKLKEQKLEQEQKHKQNINKQKSKTVIYSPVYSPVCSVPIDKESYNYKRKIPVLENKPIFLVKDPDSIFDDYIEIVPK